MSQARYRDRVVHLLALRPHKKLAVLARLQRDRINPKDLGSALQLVREGRPSERTEKPVHPETELETGVGEVGFLVLRAL